MVRVLGVKVQDKLYEEVEKICEREQVTVSDMLYEVITEFIENYKEFAEEEGEEARIWKKH
jgi:metal-responsive CopG/Arc/MetJ family transcriptional regulator